MPVFDKIILLSKQLAASLLKKESPISLEKSDLFTEEDKEYILKQVADDANISDRQQLKRLINTQEDWLKIKPQSSKRKVYFYYAAAASIALIISLSIFLNKGEVTTPSSAPIIVNNKINSGTDKAILTLASGKEIELIKGTSVKTANATGNGEEIKYDNKVIEKGQNVYTDITYNTLTIPIGGQQKITLADGTEVWLNSKSKLKYPVHFVSGETRKVTLVYGEAYFKVSPSTDHEGATFQVNHKEQNIEVLGTAFNIKAYADESFVYTTLVEGKVNISTETNQITLAPGEQSTWRIDSKNMAVATVDVKPAISWREGVFIFKRKSLKDIMLTLSRWYDFNVVFRNKDLEKIPFNGALYKNQSIQIILNDIKDFGIIKNYEINNKTIILK